MSNDLDRWLYLEIYVKASNPQLLTGLEEWLRLELINDQEVLSLSQKYLTCPVPQINRIPEIAQIKTTPNTSTTATVVESKPNIIGQIWQAFLDELSIRWLLFLGIFLVVVSSGVLAASQWNKFPVTGQYAILWLYTIGFWAIGFWLGKQNNLKLTSRTLKNIAVLLVPINFWAMSSFNLINSFSGLVIIAIAAISLTALTYWQYKNRDIYFWFLPLFLLLSYLHLGWGVESFSLPAVYIGIVAVVGSYYWLLLRQPNDFKINNLLLLLSAWLLLLTRAIFINNNSLGYSSLAIALAAWLLGTIYLHQAKKLTAIESENKIDNSTRVATAFLSKTLQTVSIIIIIFTWFISLLVGIFNTDSVLWQTTAINGLVIHLFRKRLRLYWRKRDLTAIFFIGLQSLFVAKELIPDSLRSSAIALAVDISNTKYLPESVFSVTLFPYLILFVFIATWLYRRENPQLASYCEGLTLVFGIVLTSLSLSNPTWRFLNLGLSTLTLSYVAYIRQPTNIILIYVSHCLGLFTIVSAIALLPLNLSQMAWGTILLLLAIAEWTVLISQQSQPRYLIVNNTKYKQTWYDSSWYLGLLLATISYSLFLSEINTDRTHIVFLWSLAWLIVPLMLTIVARYTRSIKQRRLAISLSCVALIVAQILTLTHFQTRFISLAAATALMFVNVYYLRKTIVAVIHLGLALSLISSVLWEFLAGWNWLILSAIAVISLYQLRLYFLRIISAPKLDYISQRIARGRLGVGTEVNNFKLSRKYAQASDYWSITISAIAVAIMTLGYLDVATDNNTISISAGHFLIASILIGGAIYSRYRQQPQKNVDRETGRRGDGENVVLTNQTSIPKIYNSEIVIYTLGWIVELAVFSSITLVGGKGIAIATANIILGLLSLWLIPKLTPISKLTATYPSPTVPVPQSPRRSSIANLNENEITSASWGISASLSQIAILYAGLGIYWRLSYFNTYTGLLTLGAALIGIGVSKYSDRHNPTINYLSLTGISLGIYELVAYQMSRSPGGNIADGFTILSLVAAAIAFSYRLTAWWWRKQNRQFLLNLSPNKIIIIAHIHWAISSILKIIAAGIAIENATPRLTIVSIAVSFLLGAYALIQGRDIALEDTQSEKPANDWWVYVGLVEMFATIVYSRLIIDKLSLFDPWRVIFTCALALIIYQIPWQNFGWRSTPWQHTALVIPALMALVTAEDISYFSLLVTAAFYLRIAYYQKNIRWSYISLGFINWGVLRFIWQYNSEAIWFAAIFSLSILYIAQFDPDLKHNRKQRHRLRLVGSVILSIVALFYQDTGIIPSAIAIVMIMAGLGLRIRAFLFVGTITFVLTIIYQLVILIFTYSILKWIIGLLTGTIAIAIAANFESKRDRLTNRLQSYADKLKQWE